MRRRLILDLLPDLASRGSAESRERLRTLEVDTVEWAGGTTIPEDLIRPEILGLVVYRGMLARCVEVAGGSSMELVSVGDLLQPACAETPSFARVSWSVLEPTGMVVIDENASRRIAAEHEVLTELVNRGTRRAHNVTVGAAIESVVGVERRVLLVLWQLAESYGVVSPEGVRLSLRLTHEMLSQLVGSRRPSVTSALSALRERNLVVREHDRGWLLKGGPPAIESSGPGADALLSGSAGA